MSHTDLDPEAERLEDMAPTLEQAAIARRRRLDMGVGAVFALGALAFIFILVPMGISVPGRVEHFGLSPRMLPIMTAALIGVFGALLFLRAAFGDAVPVEVDDLEGALRPGWPLRLLGCIALMIAYYPVTLWLGLTLTGVLVTAGMMLLAGQRKLWLVALLSIGVPVVVSLIFETMLYVPIPQPFFLN